jgi:ATP adenylyltransferase
MVCPYRHVSDYVALTPEETAELASLTQSAIRVLTAASAPHGFNLGMNQGAVAGAGIAAHLHQHVVPRWGGDANFLPIVARTRALPELLGEARQRLADAWDANA